MGAGPGCGGVLRRLDLHPHDTLAALGRGGGRPWGRGKEWDQKGTPILNAANEEPGKIANDRKTKKLGNKPTGTLAAPSVGTEASGRPANGMAPDRYSGT